MIISYLISLALPVRYCRAVSRRHCREAGARGGGRRSRVEECLDIFYYYRYDTVLTANWYSGDDDGNLQRSSIDDLWEQIIIIKQGDLIKLDMD
jgi:hypothetical protein